MRIYFQPAGSLPGIPGVPVFSALFRLNNKIIQSTTCNDKPNIYENQMYLRSSKSIINV